VARFLLMLCVLLIAGCGGSAGGKLNLNGNSSNDSQSLPSNNFSIIENYNQALSLKYPNTFTGTTCEVTDEVGVTIANACTCSVGACQVEFNPATAGSASFNYSISDNGANNYEAKGNLTVKAIVPFQSVWRVGNVSYGDGDLTVTLPLLSGREYDFTVDWGDGNTDTITSHDDVDKNHTYASAGDYTISISGLVEAWYFANTGDKDKIIAVTELGTVGWREFWQAFRGCTNLTTFEGGDLSNVTTISSMFSDSPNVTPNTSGWNTQNIKHMSEAFLNAASANPDTSNWDTSSLTNLQSAFDGATSANPDVSNWDTSRVTTIYSTFANSTINPDVSKWDTSNVTIMGTAFYQNTAANPDVSNWDTSKVQSFYAMFYGATSANPDMSGWDFSSILTFIQSVDNMFVGNTSLSTENYNNLLIGLDATGISNLNLHGGSATCSGAGCTAKANLQGRSWTITDGV